MNIFLVRTRSPVRIWLAAPYWVPRQRFGTKSPPIIGGDFFIADQILNKRAYDFLHRKPFYLSDISVLSIAGVFWKFILIQKFV